MKLNEHVNKISTDLEKRIFGEKLARPVRFNDLKKVGIAGLAALYLTTMTGCSGLKDNYKVKINGVDMYVDSGQIRNDGMPDNGKRWYQTTQGKIGIAIGAGLIGWGIYELGSDDDSNTVGVSGGGI